MWRADAGQAPRHDLSALGDELAKHAVVFVVDVFDFFDPELANFLAPEKLASATAFARRPTGPASATTAKSRTIPTRTRPLARCRMLCCFCLFSHNSPRISICQMPL